MLSPSPIHIIEPYLFNFEMYQGVPDLIRPRIFDTLVLRFTLFVIQEIFVPVLFITCQPQIATGVRRENGNSLCIWRFRKKLH